ncbi:hypothetical protein [Maribacter sp. 4G9]|uniref:hypothetical protein n=1 Tax=Maribacter sp. 4G9 TaxID=1889777 RepID=UPI000C157850|nr:hypothetical protein [Maribacter sp. 4G9]PIB28569.1 hypothetical protein BFP75_04815 [Maribacter sp. 4G9]
MADAFLNNVFRNNKDRLEQKKARTLGIMIIGILTCILIVLAYLYFQKTNELEKTKKVTHQVFTAQKGISEKILVLIKNCIKNQAL